MSLTETLPHCSERRKKVASYIPLKTGTDLHENISEGKAADWTQTKRLALFVLPQALDTDDVRLQVGIRWLHVDELADVVGVVLEAAVLFVVSLRLHVLRQAFGFLAVFPQQRKT